VTREAFDLSKPRELELTKTTRFAFVDALRGIAALGVILFHAVEGNHVNAFYDILPGWLQSFLRHGYVGVAIFFVLSGFVIAHSLNDKRMSLPDIGVFMLKRSLRLDPPYWVAIVIAVSFSMIASLAVRDRAADEFSLEQIAAHVFYLQDILGYRQVNPAFWTLCLEIQFYLVFAVLLWSGSSFLLISGFVVSLLWPLNLAPNFTGFFPNLWFGFLLGVGSYKAWRVKMALPWFLAYSAAVLAMGLRSDSPFVVACAVTALSLLFVARIGELPTFMNWKWLQFLGAISYSLYLIHSPITGATFRVGYLLTGRTIYTEALWWVISIAACLVVATLLRLFVERPMLRMSRTLFDRNKSSTLPTPNNPESLSRSL
jgi:peptidoglycan/LPS O-acetylase OafA/YrhL